MCGPFTFPPVINTFDSDLDIIRASESVVLSWDITNDVNTVTLTANGVEIAPVPDLNTATYTVTGIYETTTFVIDVDGDGGTDSATLLVEVFPYPPSNRFIID